MPKHAAPLTPVSAVYHFVSLIHVHHVLGDAEFGFLQQVLGFQLVERRRSVHDGPFGVVHAFLQRDALAHDVCTQLDAVVQLGAELALRHVRQNTKTSGGNNERCTTARTADDGPSLSLWFPAIL